MAALIVSSSVCAEYLNINLQMLQQLSREGVIPKLGQGRYDLKEAVRAYIKLLTNDGSSSPTAARNAYASSRARLYSARANTAELELGRMSGDLVHAENVVGHWVSLITQAKTKLLAIPKKLSAQLALINSPTKIETVLNAEINLALTELASTDGLPPDEDPPHANGGDKKEDMTT